MQENRIGNVLFVISTSLKELEIAYINKTQ